jgi:hypothetical protein
METRTVADITKGYPEQLAVLAQKLGAFMRTQGIEASAVVVVGREDQAWVRTVFPPELQWISVPDDEMTAAPVVAVQTVATRVIPAMVATGVRRIYILSYSGTLLGLASRSWGDDVSVQAIAFGSIGLDSHSRAEEGRSAATPTADARLAHPEEGWTYSRVCSLDEALGALEKALAGAPHGLRQTSLRPAMSLHDARFVGNGAATGTAGIVGTLVRIAEQRGRVLVERECNGAANPLITLGGAPVPAPIRCRRGLFLVRLRHSRFGHTRGRVLRRRGANQITKSEVQGARRRNRSHLRTQRTCARSAAKGVLKLPMLVAI